MFLTICTPTYNRAYTLERVYSSLIEQSDSDFEWVIIDDGSTDQTKKLVNYWINEAVIKIIYYKQENKGKHIALNKGVSLAKGELFTCLDSDDWFYKNTVEEVHQINNKIKNRKNIAGIIGLDTYENGDVIGTNFDSVTEQSINWIDLNYKYKTKGDKAYFYKTEILKKYDFPSYEGNRHMPPSYQLYQISKKYDFTLCNKPLKGVEYLEDGISKNRYNKFLVAADNFSYYSLSIATLIPSKKREIINAIQFNAAQYLGKVKFIPTDIKTKFLFSVFKPLGYLAGMYMKIKAESSENVSHNIRK